MKKFDLSKYTPLGYSTSGEKNIFLTILTCATLYSFLFFIRYCDCYSRLYTHRNGKRILVEGRMMEEFHHLANGVFYGFFIVMFVTLCFIILRYVYHYQGTKSIYTMKRLPQKSELYARCIITPLMLVLFVILLCIGLLFLYLAIYFIFTPSQCLYPFNWQSFWRALI